MDAALRFAQPWRRSSASHDSGSRPASVASATGTRRSGRRQAAEKCARGFARRPSRSALTPSLKCDSAARRRAARRSAGASVTSAASRSNSATSPFRRASIWRVSALREGRRADSRAHFFAAWRLPERRVPVALATLAGLLPESWLALLRRQGWANRSAASMKAVRRVVLRNTTTAPGEAAREDRLRAASGRTP